MRSSSRDHGIGEGGREGSTLQQEVRVCRATGDRKNFASSRKSRLCISRDVVVPMLLLSDNYDARMFARCDKTVLSLSLSFSLFPHDVSPIAPNSAGGTRVPIRAGCTERTRGIDTSTLIDTNPNSKIHSG